MSGRAKEERHESTWMTRSVKWSSRRHLFSHHKDIHCMFRVPHWPPLLLPTFDQPRFLWHISNHLRFIKHHQTYPNTIPSKLNSAKSRIIKHFLSSFKVGFAVSSVVQMLDNWQFSLHLPPRYQPKILCSSPTSRHGHLVFVHFRWLRFILWRRLIFGQVVSELRLVCSCKWCWIRVWQSFYA